MKHNNIYIRRIPELEEEKQGIENLFEKNNDRKLPKLGERSCHASPGNTEGPNQDEPKEAHSKTHYNQNGKIQRQRENLKGSKGKTASNLQGHSNKTVN